MMNMRNIKSGNFNFKIHQGGQARLNFVKQNLGGQAMILAVLALGGTILGATTIAGLLMTYQIRQTTEAANSAKAIFAADSGLECGLYSFFKNSNVCASTPPQAASLSLSNDSVAEVRCFDASENQVSCDDKTSAKTIKSTGTAAKTIKRAFLLYFESVGAVFP